MNCQNHPAAPGSPCHFCGAFLCDECTIDLGGRRTCEACKTRALAGGPVAATGNQDEALKWIVPISSNWIAVLGFWCAMLGCVPGLSLGGIGFGIIGLQRSKAAKEGFWRSIVTIVIGLLWTAFWVVGLVGAILR